MKKGKITGGLRLNFDRCNLRKRWKRLKTINTHSGPIFFYPRQPPLAFYPYRTDDYMRPKPNYRVLLMLDGCRKHHRLSQLQLYEHYFSYGMGICLRFSKNREEAQEVLNDGFLKVFRKIHQYKSSQRFEPWLRKILIHSAIDYYRKHHQGQPEALSYDTDLEDSVSNDALHQLAYEELISYLQHLTPAYRMVFNLHAVEGMTHTEIAKQLNVSVGTSKSNLAKARTKLREMITKSHDFTIKTEGNGT